MSSKDNRPSYIGRPLTSPLPEKDQYSLYSRNGLLHSEDGITQQSGRDYLTSYLQRKEECKPSGFPVGCSVGYPNGYPLGVDHRIHKNFMDTPSFSRPYTSNGSPVPLVPNSFYLNYSPEMGDNYMLDSRYNSLESSDSSGLPLSDHQPIQNRPFHLQNVGDRNRKVYQRTQDVGHSQPHELMNMLSETNKNLTVMLKNIPNRYREEDLKSVLDIVIQGCYEVVSFPTDSRTKRNLGYCFVRVKNSQTLDTLKHHMQNKLWPNNHSNKEKRCEICRAYEKNHAKKH